MGTNFSEMLSEIHAFSSGKYMSKRRPENGGHVVSESISYSNIQNQTQECPRMCLCMSCYVESDSTVIKSRRLKIDHTELSLQTKETP